MTEGVFDHRAQLAKSLVIFGNEKERIVAEAAAAAIIFDDYAMAASFNDCMDIPVWVGQGCGANVESLPLLVAEDCQLGEQPFVVGGIVALLAGVAG